MITTNEEINQAIKDVRSAENEFNFATKDFEEVAIFKLTYAMKRLDTLLHLAKAETRIKEI